MRKTTLSELSRKKGKLISPWVDKLGDILTLTSWSVERLPEYIWIALILDKEGRTGGINCCIRIFNRMRILNPSYDSAKLSSFLMLCDDNQKGIYDIIAEEVEPVALAPLTAVIGYDYSPSFFKHFYTPGLGLERRMEALEAVVRKYNNPSSNDTTDVRFLAVIPQMLSGHLHVPQNSPMTDALLYYGSKSHADEIMKVYRPSIRSLEGVIDMPHNQSSDWVDFFWKKTAQATDCKLLSVTYGKDETIMDYNQFIEKTKEAIKIYIEQ